MITLMPPARSAIAGDCTTQAQESDHREPRTASRDPTRDRHIRRLQIEDGLAVAGGRANVDGDRSLTTLCRVYAAGRQLDQSVPMPIEEVMAARYCLQAGHEDAAEDTPR
jgi:hypothetical protein